MNIIENFFSGALRLTGTSFLCIQVVALQAALYLKIKQPDFIADINSLNKSIKFLIVSLVIPAIKSVISLGAIPIGFGIILLLLKIILHIGIAVLMALSIYHLWTSIKYQKPEHN